MFVIAIAEVAGTIDEEATALAPILGTSSYDVRLALKGTPPSVVLRTPSREVAEQAFAGLRAHRCAAIMTTHDDVVPIGRMVSVRRFALDDDGLTASEGGPRLEFAEIAAIIHVATTSNVERTRTQREVRNSARGMPVTVDEDHTRVERDHDELVCLFLRAPSTPWVLHAREARYLALGPALRPTSLENFRVTVALLRTRASQAVYDDRFVTHPMTRLNNAVARGDQRPTHTIGDPGLDLPVHLLARWLLEPRGDPYRDARVDE